MPIRTGLLQLKDKWDHKDVEAVAGRFQLLEQNINDLENNPHAHAYADNISQLITIASSGVPVDLIGMTSDHSSGFIFAGTKEFTCLVPGHYMIVYSIAFDAASNNQHIESAIAKNDVWQSTATMHQITATANDTLGMSGNLLLELLLNDIVKLQIQNLSSGADITLRHVNWTIVRVHF